MIWPFSNTATIQDDSISCEQFKSGYFFWKILEGNFTNLYCEQSITKMSTFSRRYFTYFGNNALILGNLKTSSSQSMRNSERKLHFPHHFSPYFAWLESLRFPNSPRFADILYSIQFCQNYTRAKFSIILKIDLGL